jgi:hypothetical protein
MACIVEPETKSFWVRMTTCTRSFLLMLMPFLVGLGLLMLSPSNTATGLIPSRYAKEMSPCLNTDFANELLFDLCIEGFD